MIRTLLCALLALAGTVEGAHAATLTVTTTADTVSGNCTVTTCSLKDAFSYATNNGPSNTIVLAPAATYTIATPFSPGDALSQVINTVVVVGNGATIERDPTAAAFRILDVSGGSLDLQNVTIRNGSAPQGGGINNNFGVLTLTDSVVESNDASNGNSRGGGVYSTGPGPLTITRSTFRNNTAIIGGGLFATNFGTQAQITILDSAFVGNAVTTALPLFAIGGAITFAEDVNVAIISTTISSNTSDNLAGGIGFSLVQPASTVTITNTTIVQNYAGFAGGGLAAEACSSTCPNVAHPQLRNTILANNTSQAQLALNCFGPYDSGGWNILGPSINNPNCSFTNLNNDILLPGALSNIQGLGTTGLPGGQHHALIAGSIAIDTANPAFCPAADQIGASRVVICERGAIEYHVPAPTIDPCQVGKKKCIAKKVKALLTCHAKAEQLGLTLSPKCKLKAFEAFTGTDKSCCDKCEVKNSPCPTAGDCNLLEAKVDTFVEAVVQALDPFYPQAIPGGNLCSAKKKKCVAKKAIDLLNCWAKAEQTGVMETTCLSTAHSHFDGGGNPANSCFAPLEASLPCLTTNDTAALEAMVDAFVNDVICHLDPAAGTCPTIPTPTPSVVPTPTATPTLTPSPTST